MLRTVGMREGEAIESNMLTRQIERAQRKVEGHNFDDRKYLLEYDDVANDQRRVIYQQRNPLMRTDDISASLADIRAEVVSALIGAFIPPDSMEEQWDVAGLSAELERTLGTQLDIKSMLDEDRKLDEAGLRARILSAVEEQYLQKFSIMHPTELRQFVLVRAPVAAHSWMALDVEQRLENVDSLRAAGAEEVAGGGVAQDLVSRTDQKRGLNATDHFIRRLHC